jgi:hypothetical protein
MSLDSEGLLEFIHVVGNTSYKIVQPTWVTSLNDGKKHLAS